MNSNLKDYLSYKSINNELNQFILFDWFQATILSESFEFDKHGCLSGITDFNKTAIDLFKDIFKISSCDLIFESRGVNGYNANYHYNEIYIMFNYSRPEMGFHIKMSGRGCRDFENLNLDYIDFFKTINKYVVNYNRIDISIDDFSNKYFSISKLYSYVRSNCVSSKFLSVLNIEKRKLSDGFDLGHTLQFGSKASNIQITFYDKLKERESQNMIVSSNIKYWVRTELRFRHDYAKQIVDKILIDKDINKIVKSVLSEYISFKDKYSNDSNISRRDNAPWWNNFLENVDKLSLINYLPEDSISRKSNWLKNSVSKTLFMVYISNLDNLKTDNQTNELLLNLFQEGFEKFNYEDLKLINSNRISNNLIPYTEKEIFDYVQDIKDYILIKEKEN